MYTEPVTSSTGFKGKEPSANIYALIISDLTDAVAKLPPSYSGSDLGRATKGAANALLGRVKCKKVIMLLLKQHYWLLIIPAFIVWFLFLWNFDGDIKLMVLLLRKSGMSLMLNQYLKLFFLIKEIMVSIGAIMVKDFQLPGSTMRAQDYGTVWGNVIPSDRILNEFEAGDPRYKLTFWEEGDQCCNKSGNPARCN